MTEQRADQTPETTTNVLEFAARKPEPEPVAPDAAPAEYYRLDLPADEATPIGLPTRNAIVFTLSGPTAAVEILRIQPEGLTYKGVLLETTDEVHKAMQNVLFAMTESRAAAINHAFLQTLREQVAQEPPSPSRAVKERYLAQQLEQQERYIEALARSNAQVNPDPQ